MRQLVDAFADGLNYFLERNPQVKPRLLTHFEPWYIFAFGRFAEAPFGQSFMQALGEECNAGQALRQIIDIPLV